MYLVSVLYRAAVHHYPTTLSHEQMHSACSIVTASPHSSWMYSPITSPIPKYRSSIPKPSPPIRSSCCTLPPASDDHGTVLEDRDMGDSILRRNTRSRSTSTAESPKLLQANYWTQWLQDFKGKHKVWLLLHRCDYLIVFPF